MSIKITLFPSTACFRDHTNSAICPRVKQVCNTIVQLPVSVPREVVATATQRWCDECNLFPLCLREDCESLPGLLPFSHEENGRTNKKTGQKQSILDFGFKSTQNWGFSSKRVEFDSSSRMSCQILHACLELLLFGQFQGSKIRDFWQFLGIVCFRCVDGGTWIGAPAGLLSQSAMDRMAEKTGQKQSNLTLW